MYKCDIIYKYTFGLRYSSHYLMLKTLKYIINYVFTLIRVQQCEVHELSDVYVWGKHFLDIADAKKKTKFEPRKYESQCTVKTQKVMDLLTSNWIKNFFTPQFVRTCTTRIL